MTFKKVDSIFTFIFSGLLSVGYAFGAWLGIRSVSHGERLARQEQQMLLFEEMRQDIKRLLVFYEMKVEERKNEPRG